MDKEIYAFIFQGEIERIYIETGGDTKIGDLIKNYFQRIKKSNLLSQNHENTYFMYNSKKINDDDYDKKLYEYFHHPRGNLIMNFFIKFFYFRLEIFFSYFFFAKS